MSKLAIPLRYVAAIALVVSGLVHLYLYFDSYKDFPNANLGRSFLLNAIASVVVAVLVVLWPNVLTRLAGIAVAGGTLVAFALSRWTDNGIFDFTESGLNPSPYALIALIAEIVAIVVLVVLMVVDRRRTRPEPTRGERRTALAASAALLLVSGVLALVWGIGANDTTTTATTSTTASNGGAATGATAVVISDFSFQPADIKVAPGSTVTWTNNDGFAHSVVADDGSFTTDAIDSGGTFMHTFDAPGTFTYICGIHNFMKGSVVVG